VDLYCYFFNFHRLLPEALFSLSLPSKQLS